MSGFLGPWAAVDVETSGIDRNRHRVLSLAVIVLDGEGAPVEEYSTLLNPGCDPGPVHVHGLTREKLAGAPRFEEVAERTAELLSGKVMVAHNAQFDHGFLSREFGAIGREMPVERTLCTLRLNRKLRPPTADFKLGTLAAHYGVEQRQAHDALDDARVLAGILRGSLAEAKARGIEPPILTGNQMWRGGFPPSVPKQRCPYESPGRWRDGQPLVQGMKVAFTGETRVSRDVLIARSAAAGLNVMNNVSRYTSLIVANNPRSTSTKALRARTQGVPFIDEPTFLALLTTIHPGQLQTP
ncbi:exonuclease domain-containing protein [Actinocorallia sp. A-T 12471]|uniref:exonuclease domain-containing protein n=1 Tax=Actinocorallia sp. A-T 12471 TaxID=3089813 RepID=UPI0029CC7A8F|nr:exonuclease domain-containing protein [Actinocorallia sp. A-T 12471]MDX6742761.1 exonuclease domain-containing protein [Actinocorallia sp. A-T 12471]